MIRTESLTKRYGPLKALEDVTFDIGHGEIVGFLGQNGAGKTSLMRILTGFLPPSSGRAFIDNMDIQKKPMAAKRKIGYLPETPPLYLSMTVHDYLRLAARLKEIPGRDHSRMIDRALQECLLGEVKDRVIGQLSKGFKQRVGLAQAIINQPDVLILDEPTTGLDPIQNKQIRELIRGLEEKRTVILSTHHLTEIENLARRVLIIKRGRIVADDTLARLIKGASARQKIRVRLRGPKEKIYQMINAADGPELVSSDTHGDVHSLILRMNTHFSHYNTLVEKIIRTGGEVISLQEEAPSLEDVFFDAVSEKDTEK